MVLNGEPNYGTDDQKINQRYQSLTQHYKKDEGGDKSVSKPQPHGKVPTGSHPEGFMHSRLMKWTKMLESMDLILEELNELSPENDIMSAPTETEEPVPSEYDSMDSDKDIIAELNRIFTPILVMQSFEDQKPDQILEAMSEASVLFERNIIQFDDETRMGQLIAACAMLLQKKKNTEKWQMYQKAAAIRNQMKLDMQKEEYDAAKALAQKYLVNVTTTNNSSVARKAAQKLLPATQH